MCWRHPNDQRLVFVPIKPSTSGEWLSIQSHTDLVGAVDASVLTKGCENTLLYDIVGNTKFRDDLFNTRCGWLAKGQQTATKELQKHREVREKVKEAVRTFSLDSEDDDAWESLANAHLTDLDDGRSL